MKGSIELPLKKGNGDECWMIAKLRDNYSIHYFGNRMGEDSVGAGRLLGAGDRIRVCVFVQIKCFYVHIQVCTSPRSHVNAHCIPYCGEKDMKQRVINWPSNLIYLT